MRQLRSNLTPEVQTEYRPCILYPTAVLYPVSSPPDCWETTGCRGDKRAKQINSSKSSASSVCCWSDSSNSGSISESLGKHNCWVVGMQCSTAQCSADLCSLEQCTVVQVTAVQYCAVQSSLEQRCAVLPSSVQCSVQCIAVSLNRVQCMK